MPLCSASDRAVINLHRIDLLLTLRRPDRGLDRFLIPPVRVNIRGNRQRERRVLLRREYPARLLLRVPLIPLTGSLALWELWLFGC